MPTIDEVGNAIKSYATGIYRGMTTDLLGAPVDLINTAISPVTKRLGVHTDNPAFGSKHWRQIAGMPTEDANNLETAAGLVTPGGAVKAMIVGAARLGRAVEVEKAKFLLENSSANPASVYNLTGVYKDTDDKLRAVISDEAAKVTGLKIGENKQLNEVLDHPELFKLYPELKNITVVGDVRGVKEGQFRPVGNSGDGVINIAGVGEDFLKAVTLKDGSNETRDALREVLLHETQHAVQNIEGFTPGGSPNRFLPKDLNVNTLQSKIDTGRKSSDSSVRDAAERFKENINDKLEKAYDKYLAIPGEQEARFTQTMKDAPIEQLATKVLQLLKQGRSPQTHSN